MRRLVWFSCGAASAVAAKLAVEAYGSGVEVIYCDTLASEHEDNARFFSDVQRWLGVPIRVIRSEKYATVDEVFERRRYMSGPRGAICTTEMKKEPHVAYQHPEDTQTQTHRMTQSSAARRAKCRCSPVHPPRAMTTRWIMPQQEKSTKF